MKKAITLVELLIVIAIMAILCSVISRNVFKYMEARDKEQSVKVENTKTNNAESITTYTIISE